MKCNVDLKKTDEYENGIIPDEDIETALKVIRTMRTVCLTHLASHCEGAVVLSHAHKTIHDLVKAVQ